VEHENLDFDFDFFRMITKFLLSQISRREILKISSNLPGEVLNTTTSSHGTVTEIVAGIVAGTETGTQGVHAIVVDRE
jgi:hypothetical protein